MLNNIDLKGMRIAVTGGTSGLGLALVRNLAASHARVAFVARRAQLVERVSKETNACGIIGDVGLKEDIHAMALEIAWNLGGLDVLINNASSLGPTPLKLLADTECEELDEALAVNVLGPFRLTKALFGALAASAREGRGAVVINISSDAGVSAYPGWGAYGAAKAALSHMTAIWAEEARDEGVRFLSLDPGDTAPVASGWSGCRVGLAPTGKRRLGTAHTLSGHTRSALSDASGLCEAKTLIDKKALQARGRRACQQNWQRGGHGGQRAGSDLRAHAFKCWWTLGTFSIPAGIAERRARLRGSGDCGSATIRSGHPRCSRRVACRARRERERHREHA